MKNTGRPRVTAIDDDLNISLQAIENPRLTRAQIKDKCELNCGLSTIGKRLNESGLFCRVARIKEHLSAGHKARRLQFAENHLNFPFWDRTVIVDESTFMTGHAVKTLIRRPINAAYDQKYIVERAQSGRMSIPVFGLMHAGVIGPLVRIDGAFNAEKYIDILNDTVLPYVEEHFPDGHFYYYQDNSPIHKARIVKEWFQENIPNHQLFETPPKSPDIPPIENLWGRAKVKVANDGIYENCDDLWLAISDAWIEMRENINYAQNLINSIPNRLQAIIDCNGNHTKY